MTTYFCTECNYSTIFHSILLGHYTKEHESQPNFSVTCNINGCLQQYRKIFSLRRHISRHHREFLHHVRNFVGHDRVANITGEQYQGDHDSDLCTIVHKYIVKYKGINIRIEVEKKEDILAKAREKFIKIGIPVKDNVLLCTLDKDLGDFYVMDDINQAPDTGILKIEDRPDIEFIKCETDEGGTSSAPSSSSSETTSEISLNNPVKNESSSHSYNAFIPVDRFPASLLSSLAQKTTLDKSMEKIIVQILYEKLVSDAMYPTQEQFQSVVVALLQKYPHLSHNLPLTDAKAYWRCRLSHKLRNMRRIHNHEAPEVVRRRTKGTGTTGSQKIGKNKKTSAGYGCKNYISVRPAFEDDASIKAHIDKLKLESKKKIQNHKSIDISMTQTFGDRRSFVVNQSPGIVAVKEQYPCLFGVYQIMEEFQRITEVNIVQKMEQSLLKYGPALVALHRGEDPGDLSPQHMALEAIPLLMKETLWDSGAAELNCEKMEPLLILEETMRENPDVIGKIVAEGEVICQTQGLLQGYCAWLATCYVFNTCYPESYKNTLQFIQKVMLELQVQYKTPLVISVFKKIVEYNHEY